MSKASWLHLHPSLGNGTVSRQVLADLVSALPSSIGQQAAEREAELERFRRRAQRARSSWPKQKMAALTATINIISDLAKQGWLFRVDGTDIYGHPPPVVDTEMERERRRSQLASRRNEQLREESTRTFIQGMEHTRASPKRRVSIFSLMRDGRDLASRLTEATGGGTSAALFNAIEPFVQFVEKDAICTQTGLSLGDIWRYFRHTWANSYESIPGRTMMLLVRDKAAPSHPVIGLAALSSAAVKLRARDEYLGWEGDAFLAEVDANPSEAVGQWLLKTVQESIGEIYRTDLVRDGLLPRAQFGRRPARSETIEALLRDAETNRETHHRQAESGEYKKAAAHAEASVGFWRKQAETPLFRSKRAAALADLLSLNATLCDHLSESPTTDELRRLLATSGGRQAVAKIVRIAKADTVGTAIADLTVCGAIPPYNTLLGGKLVAMLAVSPAVVAEYERRYREKSSIIASSMAGRSIVRRAHLVFIGTTSLYGVRPSQYDRIAIPCEMLGGAAGKSIKYDFIERTVGWGTFQFGKTTKASIEQYVVSQKSGWRVNNVFGEGANPRMRALREGLAKLGLDEEELLHHGQQKTMYGVKLAENTKEYLLGLEPKPRYFFSTESPAEATRVIANHWATRWLQPRLVRPEVMEQIKAHTLVFPITHGARVLLPDGDLEQGSIC